jgi:GT2 family glycosyltransferase
MSAVESVPSAAVQAGLDGYLEFYGYSRLAQGWFIGGWTSQRRDSDQLEVAELRFEAVSLTGDFLAAKYTRDDLGKRGVGHIIFIRAAEHASAGQLRGLVAKHGGEPGVIKPTRDIRSISAMSIDAVVRPLLGRGTPSTQRDVMNLLLLDSSYGRLPRPFNFLEGAVDFYGYCTDHWLLAGWLNRSWADGIKPAQLILRFEHGEVSENFVAHFNSRPGHPPGFVLAIKSPRRAFGRLLHVEVISAGATSSIDAAHGVRQSCVELANLVRPLISSSPNGEAHSVLARLVQTGSVTRDDDLKGLRDSIFIHFDEVIYCPPNGVALIGWHLAPKGSVKSLTLHSGGEKTAVNFDDRVVIERADVIEEIGRKKDFTDQRCGFLIFLPTGYSNCGETFIEIETSTERRYLSLPNSRLSGLEAIKRLTRDVRLQRDDLAKLMASVLGPAIVSLNDERCNSTVNAFERTFGKRNEHPKFSVIVPLYGRVDFIEAQLGLFSADPTARDHDFIYVLDDPTKQRELEELAESCFERFGIPFRVICLSENRGFSAANNVGLRAAAGDFVCFLNSDVFSNSMSWLEKLSTSLSADPKVGAVGATLIYEDGSVQHRGMTYKRLPEHGNWFYCDHPGKGLKKSTVPGLHKVPALTGACILMRRDLALEMGGFSERYVNDFEDADLCLRLQQRGYWCGINNDVELYHLERKSHPGASQLWSRNLIYFNAWLHNKLWASMIETLSIEVSESNLAVAKA